MCCGIATILWEGERKEGKNRNDERCFISKRGNGFAYRVTRQTLACDEEQWILIETKIKGEMDFGGGPKFKIFSYDGQLEEKKKLVEGDKD